MLLMTEVQWLAAVTLLVAWCDVSDGASDDDDDHDATDDGAVTVTSRDVDARDNELAYRFCSLIRLQLLRTAVKHILTTLTQRK